MIIFYRISESTNTEHAKARTWQVKLSNATKKNCLLNTVKCFPKSDIVLYVDGITDETWSWLCALEQTEDRISIKKINAGSDAKSFRCLLEDAIKLNDDDCVLFQEDDYLYLENSEEAILEALEYSDYVTGYLHPDKFILPQYGGNPYVEVQNVSEPTRIVLTNHRFWMLTNSTTNTFATKARILKEDYELWMEGTADLVNTKDFQTFLKLRERGRSLVMPLPSLATHCLKGFEAPLVGLTIDSWELL